MKNPTASSNSQESEWQKTLNRLGLGKVDIAEVRPTDILYIVDRWPFLQVIESSGSKQGLENPEFITASSGWTIINYGNAMSTSPGKYLFQGGYFRVRTVDDDDEGGGGIVNPGKGTIVKQSFDSAAHIIRLAKELGWLGVEIIDGHPAMQRAAWVEACRIGIKLDGYKADIAAEKIRRRIVSQSIDEMHAVLKGAPRS